MAASKIPDYRSGKEDHMASASNCPTRSCRGFRLVSRAAIAVITVLLFALPAAAQGNEDDGYRDSLVMNDNGEALVIFSPENSGTDPGLQLRLRSAGGSETTLATDGQSITTSAGSETLVGFGSNPSLNNNGMAAFMGGIEYDGDTWENDDACGIFRVTTSSFQLIAEGRGDDPQGTGNGSPDGQSVSGDTLCSFEPMPAINDSGQVVFGAHMDRGDEAANSVAVRHFDFEECGNRHWDEALYIDAQSYPHERKGIFRWTSGTGIEMLLRTYDDTIFVANSGNTAEYVSADTTFEFTKAGFTHTGGRVFNNSGNAVCRAFLDDDTTDDSSDTNTITNCLSCVAGVCDCDQREAWRDDLDAIMYLRGPSDAFDLVAATSPPGGGSVFQELNRPVMNDSGQVLFVGAQGTDGNRCGYGEGWCNEDWVSINLWTRSGGRTELFDTNDQAPNSDYYFQGFSPHHSINSSGEVAFVAGLNDAAGPQNGNQSCGQGVYYWDGSSLTEVARAMNNWVEWDSNCSTDTGGPFTTSFDGFVFEEIGSMASVTDNGWVFFVVENYDTLSSGPCDGFVPDGDEVTALLGWHPNQGMVEIMREGFEYEGEIVNRIYAPQPELRDQTYGDQFAATVVFDADRDCESFDSDDYVEVVVPDIGAQAAEGIPTLGKTGIVLLIVLLAGVGVAMSRRFV
jgi:hypothetical protein